MEILFFSGLLVSPHLVSLFDVSLLNIEFPVEGPLLITAAILVGIGTQLGMGVQVGMEFVVMRYYHSAQLLRH